MDISANKLLWDNQIPAYLVTITPHSMRGVERELDFNQKLLAMAVSQIYAIVTSINLTKDTYEVMDSRIEISPLGARDGYDAMIKQAAELVSPNERLIFEQRFNRRALLDAFEKGDSSVHLEHQSLNGEVFQWMSTRVVRVENPYGDDVLAILLHRDIKERKEQEEQLKTTLEMTYENIQGLFGSYLVRDGEVQMLSGSRKFLEETSGKGGGFLLPNLTAEKQVPYLNKLIKAAETKKPVAFDYSWPSPEGSANWYHMQAFFIEQRQGGDVYLGIFQDVTKKKLLELEQEATYNSLPGGIVKVLQNEKLNILEANPAFYQIMGRTKEAFENGIRPFIYEEDLPLVNTKAEATTRQNQHLQLEHRMKRPDGSLFWVHVEGRKIDEVNGCPLYLIVMLDITKQKETQLELEKTQLRYRMAIENNTDIRLEYDSKTDRFFSLNSGLEEDIRSVVVYDYDLNKDELAFSGSSIQQFKILPVIKSALAQIENSPVLALESRRVIRKIIAQCQAMPCSVKGEIKLKTAGGEFEWFELHAYALWDEKAGNCVNIVGKLININALKIEAAQWREQAKRDGLTGLYNRKAFKELMEEATRCKEQGEKGALIFMDIDNFKQINDSMGHPFGDKILKLVSKRISNTVRKTDMVARFGGDEFVIYIREISSMPALEAKVRQLCEIFRQDYREADGAISISGSIGVALFPEDGQDYRTLLEKADQALYRSKKCGKDQYAFFRDLL